MKSSRRTFLSSSAALASSFMLSSCSTDHEQAIKPQISLKDRFDPWIEVLPNAIKHNVKTLHRLSGNRPILAVIKNNGYGLGDVTVAKIMDEMPEVVGFAAVKTDACLVKNALFPLLIKATVSVETVFTFHLIIDPSGIVMLAAFAKDSLDFLKYFG